MITRVPGAVATRSKLVRANGFVFFNVVPSTKEPDTYLQMVDALRIVDERLGECKLDKSKLIGITVFIAGIARKDRMNEAWDEWVDKAAPPIRACIGASLDGGDLVEFSVVACDA
jgi:enamine deaminase RidA (YjgF/YER057c/UK114 family)